MTKETAQIVTFSLVYCFLFVAFQVPFSEPDDYLMSYIANGSMGNAAGGDLIYPSSVFSVALHYLYTINANVNWYGVFLIATQAISFSVWLWICIDKGDKVITKTIVFVSAMLSLFVTTFTMTSYMSIFAGIALLLYNGKGCAQNKRKILALALIIWGYCIRNNTIVSAGVLFSGTVFSFWQGSNIKSGQWRFCICGAVAILAALVLETSFPWTRKVLLAIALLLLCILLFGKRCPYRVQMFYCSMAFLIVLVAMITSLDRYVEVATGRSEFHEYTQARSQALDHGYVPYEKIDDQLSEIGISEVEYQMLFDWSFADKEVFSKEKLQQVAHILAESSDNSPSLADLCTQIFKARVLLAILFPAVVAFLLALKGEKKIHLQNVIWTIVVLWGLVLVLALRQRLVTRVYLPLSIGCALQIILLGSTRDMTLSIGKRIECAISAGLLCALPLLAVNKFILEKNENEVKEEISNYTLHNADTLFIMQSDLYNTAYYGAPIVSVKQTSMFRNVMKSGSGDTFSPQHYEQAMRWQLTDPNRPLMALIQREDIQYIGYNFELYKEYLEQESELKLQCVQVESFSDEIGVYRFSAVK